MITTLKIMRNMQMVLNKKNSQQQDKKSIICLQPSDPYLYKIYTTMISLLKTDKSFTDQF